MAYLKLVNHLYCDNNAISYVFRYITDFDKTKGYTGTRNIILDYAPLIMEATQKAFLKEDGNRLIHFIISFSETESYSKYDALTIAHQTALLFPDHQIIFGVHSGTDNIHIHFMINSVSFVDGSKLAPDKTLLNALQAHCSQFIPNLQCHSEKRRV